LKTFNYSNVKTIFTKPAYNGIPIQSICTEILLEFDPLPKVKECINYIDMTNTTRFDATPFHIEHGIWRMNGMLGFPKV